MSAAPGGGGGEVLQREGQDAGPPGAIRVVESSGSLSLDRAAATALGTSRFLPLPEAYPAQSVMMRVRLVHGGGMK
jgi:hypothetical protein